MPLNWKSQEECGKQTNHANHASAGTEELSSALIVLILPCKHIAISEDAWGLDTFRLYVHFLMPHIAGLACKADKSNALGPLNKMERGRRRWCSLDRCSPRQPVVIGLDEQQGEGDGEQSNRHLDSCLNEQRPAVEISSDILNEIPRVNRHCPPIDGFLSSRQTDSTIVHRKTTGFQIRCAR